MIIEIIISEFDFHIMENIRKQRIKAGMDQVELAQKLGVSEGYVGNIENPKHSAKVNTRMLARIAAALDLKTYTDLLPLVVLSNDMVRIRLELIEISSRSQSLDKDGNVPKRLEIISIKPLSDKDMETLKARKNGLKYCTIISSAKREKH
ncbi:helix-turn-helix transcriptional regulator [Flavobacterium sp. D11R37]|jgi:transcriptional regulator with XRE-family HTH domain|uniref:helix-turn-helix domain-containing protein n=1 Tax=Flavobacterium coralii TaxID=2838017 RepID=UPI001CA696F7|nr:helix-turn-helix transcriptional regulator [Flavobacterium coralii]MBY8963161.1 helix-turn-helix transcriptional regulator [Flavobacterium coralii]